MMPDRAEPPGAAETGGRRRSTLPAELRPLVTLATAALIIAGLYWGRTVFIPIALAALLTFLLSPVVGALDRRRLGPVTSVLVVVLVACGLAGGIGWVLARQLSALADELPRYSANIRQRVATLRGLGRGGSVEKVQRTVEEVMGEIQKGDPPAQGDDKPIPVVVAPPSTLLSRLPGLLDTLATAGVVAVLVIFMLLERQELRNRLIRLVGYRRLTVTTKALDEAGTRISRYLLMQSIINGSFGAAVGLVLFALGIPYAALWGVLAAILRFIPYVGPWIAALLPTTLALAVFPGWTRPLLVLGAFLVLELVANMILEPWLFGQSAGVSQVALLVAVIFWTWLWGPVGLMLATPLTVCLIVLGKHLPAMGFLVVLMGDEPVLAPRARYYQRLLARDRDEAADTVDAYVKASPPQSVHDEVLLPALYYASQDRDREDISDLDAQFVARATREIVDELTPDRPGSATSATAVGGAGAPRPLLLMCPARDELDAVALAMVEQLVDPARVQVETLGVSLLTSEVTQLVEDRRPALLCIGSVAPGGVTRVRHLCKRLRARCPDVKVVVGRWGLHEEQADERRQLEAAGADRVATSMLEMERHLAELSLLVASPAPAPGEARAPAAAPGLPALAS
jgi:predicted PurR-regulated permease PerM